MSSYAIASFVTYARYSLNLSRYKYFRLLTLDSDVTAH